MENKMKKGSFSSSVSQHLKQPLIEKKKVSSPVSALVRLYHKFSPNRTDHKAEDLNAVTPTTSKLRKFEQVFRYFDEDGDGMISPAELQTCMKTVSMEISMEEAKAVVESTDSNGDGLLDFEDFIRLIEVDGEEEKKRDLREAFGIYEMEGSGCITPNSLKRTLSRLGDSKTIEECAAMIHCFDLNGDGVLSFDEFMAMML